MMLDDDALLPQPEGTPHWTAAELHEQHLCWIRSVDRRSDWSYRFRLQSTISVELVPLRLRTPDQDGIDMDIPSVQEQIRIIRSRRLRAGEQFLLRDLLEYIFDEEEGTWLPAKACSVLLKDVCVLECDAVHLGDLLHGTPGATRRMEQISLAHLYAEHAKWRFMHTVCLVQAVQMFCRVCRT